MNIETFVGKLEDYFGGKYTKTQREEVSRWTAKHTGERMRAIIYRYAVETLDTQFKTPPTVKKLNALRVEVAEAYPEISASRARDTDQLQIEESAGYDPGNLWEKVFEAAAKQKGVTVEQIRTPKKVGQ